MTPVALTAQFDGVTPLRLFCSSEPSTVTDIVAGASTFVASPEPRMLPDVVLLAMVTCVSVAVSAVLPYVSNKMVWIREVLPEKVELVMVALALT